MIQKIGSMVYQLRKKVYVSQESLGRGLLSVPELSRIENGEKEGDSFLMSTLFQRLGKSMDQFEMAVSNDEYKLVLLRAFIQESMESGDYGRTDELLDEYEDSPESEKLLHVQYTKMIRSILRYVQDKDAAVCLAGLKDAIGMTFEDEGRVDWTGYCFCIQEVQLFLLIAYMEMEVGAVRDAVLLLKKIHDCIDTNYTSEVSKVQVYPKCCYLLVKAYLMTRNKKKALEVCNKGIECLIQKGSLIFMEELLEIQQRCETNERNKKALEGIKFAYRLAEYSLPEEFVVRLLFGGLCQEITLSNELIREMRIAQGWSQEEVSDGICSRETLARIEKGRTPSRKNLQELLKKLNVTRERYYSYVITDDWDTYEMVRDYKRRCFMGDHDDALDILEKVKDKIDMTEPANKQFVETAYLRYKIKTKQIGNEEAIERLKDILKYTMPEYDGVLFRVPYREEFMILNRMALCLKWSGKKEEAIVLYEQIMQKYQSSTVKPEHHMHAMTLLHLNSLGLLERCDRLEEAEKMGKAGAELMLKYQRGDLLALFLANISCVYGKKDEGEANTLELSCLVSSYEILSLFRLEKKSKTVKRYLDEYYARAGLS